MSMITPEVRTHLEDFDDIEVIHVVDAAPHDDGKTYASILGYREDLPAHMIIRHDEFSGNGNFYMFGWDGEADEETVVQALQKVTSGRGVVESFASSLYHADTNIRDEKEATRIEDAIVPGFRSIDVELHSPDERFIWNSRLEEWSDSDDYDEGLIFSRAKLTEPALTEYITDLAVPDRKDRIVSLLPHFDSMFAKYSSFDLSS